jgi:threonine synthase
MNFEQRILELYCQGMFTEEEEAKARIIEREKAQRREAIEKYLDLYLEGHITKDDLLDTLTE